MNPVAWAVSIGTAIIVAGLVKIFWDGRGQGKTLDNHSAAIFGPTGHGGLVRDCVDIKADLKESLEVQNEIKVQLLGLEGTGGMIQKLQDLGRAQYRMQEVATAHEARVSLLEAVLKIRERDRT